jgi:hypothetical protein
VNGATRLIKFAFTWTLPMNRLSDEANGVRRRMEMRVSRMMRSRRREIDTTNGPPRREILVKGLVRLLLHSSNKRRINRGEEARNESHLRTQNMFSVHQPSPFSLQLYGLSIVNGPRSWEKELTHCDVTNYNDITQTVVTSANAACRTHLSTFRR